MTRVTTGLSVCRLIGRSVGWAIALAELFTCVPVLGQTTLTVAAAADLQPLMQKIVASYEAAPGSSKVERFARGKIALVFGSSGNLTSQIENGAPYDIFFSADSAFPRRLISGGKAVPDSFHVYAIGKLAIWVPASSRLDLDRLGAKALLDPSVHKIAIANPQHAPYGRAAVEALKTLGIYDQAAPKLVLGENVSQAAEFVTSGNAQAGILALSLIMGSKMKYGRYWIVPQQAYTPLQQGVVIVAGTKHLDAAREFVDSFLRHHDPRLMQSYGFDLPPSEEHK